MRTVQEGPPGERAFRLTAHPAPEYTYFMARPDWDSYFLMIAEVVAKRATCPRAQVGAVIVDEQNRVLSTGYNGSTPGKPHCTDVGCDMVDDHCQRTLHAEVNAVAHAARRGVRLEGSRLYIHGGRSICRECAKVLDATGIMERTQDYTTRILTKSEFESTH